MSYIERVNRNGQTEVIRADMVASAGGGGDQCPDEGGHKLYAEPISDDPRALQADGLTDDPGSDSDGDTAEAGE